MKFSVCFLLLVVALSMVLADPEPLLLKKKIKKIKKFLVGGLKKAGGSGGLGGLGGLGGKKFGGGGASLLHFKPQPIAYVKSQGPSYPVAAPSFPAPEPFAAAVPAPQCFDRTVYETITVPGPTYERTVQAAPRTVEVHVPDVRYETVFSTSTEFYQRNIERTTTTTYHNTEYVTVPVDVVRYQTQYQTETQTVRDVSTQVVVSTKTAQHVTTEYYEVPKITTVERTSYQVVTPRFVSSTVNILW